MPTGAGTQRAVSLDSIREVASAWFLPDRHHVLIAGRTDRGWNAFIQDLRSGEPRLVAPTRHPEDDAVLPPLEGNTRCAVTLPDSSPIRSPSMIHLLPPTRRHSGT